MAIGTISSPVKWNTGTVVVPNWTQAVQDNINYLYQGTGASGAGLYYWIMPSAMQSVSDWAFNAVNLGAGNFYTRKASTNNVLLLIPLTFPGNGDASFQQITEVGVALSAGSTGAVTIKLWTVQSLTGGGTNGVTKQWTSSGSGFQFVTSGVVTVNPASATAFYVEVTSAQANDQVYGVRVKIG